jgi:hypothetical protein
MKTTSESQNDEIHPAGRTATDMTDESAAPNQPEWPLSEPGHFWMDRKGKLSWCPYGHHNQQSVEPDPIAEPELPINSKLEDKYRNFEFRRRFEKIQFQVRCEFELAAAKLALELQRSKPLADALNQPGPCDGDLHSKIMPWRQA